MSDRLVPSTSPTAAGPPLWRRSSRSTGMNNCVETARLGDLGVGGADSGGALLAVRDSKDVDRPPLRFSATAWTTFVAGLDGHQVS
ncbi:DUF397 domain-containing protein [Streptomyces cyaneofuscatus]|uniref:DUF397 domain-containing protein n=1 Tax=Streptomyces cyaneofuscatus TaxID=66883 RepID=A0ABZ1EQM8_9ACTN|nr:DUF397 domain-containing protein [Streptomyces cyaneofuscatus]WSB06360.1 DUF397 domain-containing protein [Streptomyces cyaneofuscatus]WSD50105.1 DUF397 domain-containing protein [Streptomyces cyaneofuscatus]